VRRLPQAALPQILVKLYDAWHAAERGKGYDTKAAEWRANSQLGRLRRSLRRRNRLQQASAAVLSPRRHDACIAAVACIDPSETDPSIQKSRTEKSYSHRKNSAPPGTKDVGVRRGGNRVENTSIGRGRDGPYGPPPHRSSERHYRTGLLLG